MRYLQTSVRVGWTRLLLAFAASSALLGVSVAPVQPAVSAAQQSECFLQETGFCIDEPAFRDYYDATGRETVLGYPVSRKFKLEGFSVQFFQRVVLQLQGSGVARLNLLDSGLLPVTHANQSGFPAPDPVIAAAAPRADDTAYADRVVEYVREVAPDRWNGLPVDFSRTFTSTVPASSNPALDTLRSLEIWGLPTSAPAYDPGNLGFVYQRFQRGIMHFRTDCSCTNGILVGDYLKAVLTGRNLPDDLAADMRASRYFGQYAPGAPGWLSRPADLADTDLTAAFEPGTDQPNATPQASPTPLAATATPVPIAPTATPVPIAPTATPVPTAAPTQVPSPTVVTTASITGKVVDAPTDGATVRLLGLPFSAVTDANGEYTMTGLPLGVVTVYATYGMLKTQGLDVTLPTSNAVTPLRLSGFQQAPPVVFRGKVTDGKNGITGAMIWRLGGAGYTKTRAGGSFMLVDAYGTDMGKARTTEVTFVAMNGNRWGWKSVDFSSSTQLQKLEIALDRQVQGQLQVPTAATYDLTKPPPTIQKPKGKFFTALWQGATPTSMIGDFQSTQQPSTQDPAECWGDCPTADPPIRYMIFLPTDDLAITPKGPFSGLYEAQVVGY